MEGLFGFVVVVIVVFGAYRLLRKKDRAEFEPGKPDKEHPEK